MAINKTAARTYAVDFRDHNRRRIQRTFDMYKAAAEFEKMLSRSVQARIRAAVE
jgi:hypothetical protein